MSTPVGPRCSVLSEEYGEEIAGTAPTEAEWLLVEDAGPWAAKATAHLAGRAGPGGRVQLIRRHGRTDSAGPRRRVFRVWLGDSVRVASGFVDDLAELDDLDRVELEPYAGALWLVCTNGRRDVCCAERGRPVAAALAQRWPEETWETTHLGGHRFAATLLALPHGVVLGHLDAGPAVAACADLLAGRRPPDVVRGRAGVPCSAQWAEEVLRREHGWRGLDDVAVLGVDGDEVRLATPDGMVTMEVATRPGPARTASCGGIPKVTSSYSRVSGVVRHV